MFSHMAVSSCIVFLAIVTLFIYVTNRASKPSNKKDSNKKTKVEKEIHQPRWDPVQINWLECRIVLKWKKKKIVFIFYYLAFCNGDNFFYGVFIYFFLHSVYLYFYLFNCQKKLSTHAYWTNVSSWYTSNFIVEEAALDFVFLSFILSRIFAQNHMLLDTTEQSFLIATHHAFNKQ